MYAYSMRTLLRKVLSYFLLRLLIGRAFRKLPATVCVVVVVAEREKLLVVAICVRPRAHAKKAKVFS